MGWLQNRKAKRDAKLLAIYRDWPPDMVDEFLAWDHASPLSVLYWSDAPKGYASWQIGLSYAAYKLRPWPSCTVRRR